MNIEIGPAEPDDIDKFSMGRGWPTMRVWVGKGDGEPIALFGFARGTDGRWYVFFDITDKARRYKKLIVQTGKTVMAEAKKMRLRYVYAQVEETEPMARRWMKSLGFEEDPRSGGLLMRWVNDGMT